MLKNYIKKDIYLCEHDWFTVMQIVVEMRIGQEGERKCTKECGDLRALTESLKGSRGSFR